MRIAYLDCFAGIAGDMFLGALLDAGVPAEVLHQATADLDIGASLQVETVDRSGISSTYVRVLDRGEPAETEPAETAGHTHSFQPQTQHQHKTGEPHSHEAPAEEQPASHVHGRSLPDIRALIHAAPLHAEIKAHAVRVFELLGASEARIHNVPVENIHFHEVGAVDAIVDIVAACAGIHHLQIGAWYSSPVNVGGGMVRCAHGNFPVPAPATADLLRGFPTYSAHLDKELATPTGAALLRSLNPAFGRQPPMRVETIGYGAGTRNPDGFPNVLRLSVGTGTESVTEIGDMPHSSALESVTVLEAALDDLSPQVLAYVAEKALSEGALDVMLTPVVMKKGRPGTLLTVLCQPAQSEAMQRLMLAETTTLGVRVRQDQRVTLQRELVPVATKYGIIRMKLGTHNGEERNLAPEFEDCRAAAVKFGVPLKQVQQAALVAYRQAS